VILINKIVCVKNIWSYNSMLIRLRVVTSKAHCQLKFSFLPSTLFDFQKKLLGFMPTSFVQT